MRISPRTSAAAAMILLAFAIPTAPADDRAAPSRTLLDTPNRPERLAIRGIENAFRLTPNLYSGGEPHGREALEALKTLGIRTIISVDGSAPDVEAARQLGLRYVHLPVGYDGIGRDQAVRIVRAASTLPGPVFVHCHHGKHRGPAAAALCVMAAEGWGRDDALAWLGEAGTAPEYRGLFATVREFRPPSAAEADKAGVSFPEKADTPAFVDAMVAIDGRWDRLKASRDAGFRPPPDHPDVAPAREALLLAEDFRELARVGEAKEDAMTSLMEESARLARTLESSLRRLDEAPAESSRKDAEAAFAAVGKACTRCHARHRDNP